MIAMTAARVWQRSAAVPNEVVERRLGILVDLEVTAVCWTRIFLLISTLAPLRTTSSGVRGPQFGLLAWREFSVFPRSGG